LRRNSSFLDGILVACNISRIELPFEWIHFFKKKNQTVLFGTDTGFKLRLLLFLLFELGNGALKSAVFWLLLLQ
jgi:hypothetical protein